jgi:hypothetical protein
LAFTISACHRGQPSKVLFLHDQDGHYVEVREGAFGEVSRKAGHVAGRPDLEGLVEVNDDLPYVCKTMLGLENPRVVIESKDTRYYRVVFNRGPESLKVIAEPLGLAVTQEEQQVPAITLRVAKGGHQLQAAAKDEQTASLRHEDNGRLRYEGITAGELAQALEREFRRPVVDLTSLEGRWSFTVSEEAIRQPGPDETVKLDDLGLEMRWENVKVRMTVVKDRPKE